MKKGGINPAAVVILLAMLGSILFYVIEVTPTERAALIDSASYSNVILDVSPGTIRTQKDIGIETTTYALDSVTITNASVDTTSLLSDQAYFKRSAFSEDPASIGFRVTDLETFDEALLTFYVSGGRGDLLVHLNDNLIYSAPSAVDSQVAVPLDLALLNEGFNELKFSVSGPGVEFWVTNFYFLTDINILTSTYPVGSDIAERTFVLKADILETAESVDFKALALRLSQVPAKVTLLLNNKLLYESELGSRSDLNVPIPLDFLQAGVNRLTWMVDKGGAYRFTFAKVVAESLLLEDTKFYTFEISQRDWNRILARKIPQDVPAYGCYLNLTRSAGGKSISVRSNSQSFVKRFGEQDKLTVNICESLKLGSNTISLSAEDTVAIDDMTLEIRNV